MRLSQFPLSTLKELPNDAEVISHQLMLRAGLIRKLASGLYSWMPLGVKVLKKVERIIREEMDRAGAIELLMPTVQPSELWQESGRWEKYGPELMRIEDRHQRQFCYGPTHEEVITDIARKELKSYRQLPINWYQIQLKFRDEIRPRFGIMRAREFVMKDAYSFHIDQASLDETYQVMYQTYCQIFQRLALNFRAVQADTGSIGGNKSHEFHVLADSGEDAIVFANESEYAANIELAPCNPTSAVVESGTPTPMQEVDTPEQHSVEDVARFLNIEAATIIKTLFIKRADHTIVALLLRGDHQLNQIKAEKLSSISGPVCFASAEEIKAVTGAAPGSVGPVGLSVPLVVDHAARELSSFVCGANKDGKHLIGVCWGRDLPAIESVDIRNIEAGDPSPDGHGVVDIARGIEVGHIFQLGDKYSKALNATVLDQDGKETIISMGCYGIGVTRVIAAAIEQHHDDRGIIWPVPMAPFHIAIIAINLHKSDPVKQYAEKLYQTMLNANIEILLDDRPVQPGVKFADIELIGIPHIIIIGEKNLNQGCVEYKNRRENSSEMLSKDINTVLKKFV